MSLTMRSRSSDTSTLTSAPAFGSPLGVLQRETFSNDAPPSTRATESTGAATGRVTPFSVAQGVLSRAAEDRSSHVTRRTYAAPQFSPHVLSWLPGLLFPAVVALVLALGHSAHIAVPGLGEALVFAIVLAGVNGTRTNAVAVATSVALYAYQIWPYLATNLRGPTLWNLGWFALAALSVFCALETLRWRGQASTRAGSQLRRELLDAFQKHERSAAEMACVLEQVSEGIIICDPEGRVTFANAEARRLHGMSLDGPAQLIGRDCRFTTLEGETLSRIQLPLARAVQGVPVANQECCVRRADGSETVIQGSAAPVRDHEGNLLGAVTTLRNTSMQRREVVALENSNRIKTEFLSVLSHELRTPLTPILGWVTLLRGHHAAANDPTIVAEALEAIERNALSQKRLIDDLIDAISLLSGELKICRNPALLPSLLKECIADLEANASLRDIKFQLDCESPLPPLLLDEPRFAQAMRQIIANAVKFSHDGGTVTLRACYRPDVNLEGSGSGVVTLDVIDRGEGITPEIMPYIFELFRQGDGSATRRHDGLGVGLTVARTITEMHGGDLSVYSEGEGYGARFTLILPVPEVPTT